MTEKIERLGLKPHLNKRIPISGNFHKFDVWHDSITRRDYATMVLQDVFVGAECVADHLWVHHAEPLRELSPELDLGEEVRLSALVKEYRKRERDKETGKSETLVSYFLDRPDGIHLPGRELIAHRNGDTAMKIIGPIPPLPPIKPATPAFPFARTQHPATKDEPLDYMRLIRDCRELSKRCGGLLRLRDLVNLLLEE